MDYRRSVGRPMDGGDPRTPMAWQHRDMNFAYGDTRETRYSSERETRGGGRNTGPNTPSTSSRAGKGAEARRDQRGSSSDR